MPDLNCPDCETETLELEQAENAPIKIVGVAKVEDIPTGPYHRRYQCTTCALKLWRQDDP